MRSPVDLQGSPGLAARFESTSRSAFFLDLTGIEVAVVLALGRPGLVAVGELLLLRIALLTGPVAVLALLRRLQLLTLARVLGAELGAQALASLVEPRAGVARRRRRAQAGIGDVEGDAVAGEAVLALGFLDLSLFTAGEPVALRLDRDHQVEADVASSRRELEGAAERRLGALEVALPVP